MSSAYTPEALQSRLSTSLLGKRIEIHPQVGSTNDLVREAARRGEAEGLVIAAEEQLAGRGRLGRVWAAPSGCCILCSVLLRPRFAPQQAFYLTIAASLAIYRALRTMDEGRRTMDRRRTKDDGRWTVEQEQNPKSKIQNPKSQVAIKWPNDVLIGGRKVAGILCESEFVGGDWAFAVVGFGINVNMNREQLGDLAATATSLSIEWGQEVARVRLLANVLGELEKLYDDLHQGTFRLLFEEWAAALETPGKRVTVQEGTERLSGEAVRVDPGGALVLRLESGVERRVLAGDVTLLPVRENLR